jgi:hypothetical protein
VGFVWQSASPIDSIPPATGSPFRRQKSRHAGVHPNLDAGFCLYGAPECALEYRAAGTERDEIVVVGPHVPGEQVVLPVLQGTEPEHRLKDVRRVLPQHLAPEGQEVVRLTKVSDARTIPALEQSICIGSIHRPVPINQDNATAVSRERESRCETCQACAEDDYVRRVSCSCQALDIMSGRRRGGKRSRAFTSPRCRPV